MAPGSDTADLAGDGRAMPQNGNQETTATVPNPGRSGAGQVAGLTASVPAAAGPVAPGPAAAWHRWRVPLALIAVILLGATVIAILLPASRPNGYLDPASTRDDGTHALADILAERGDQVISTYSPSAALAASRSGGSTLVITSPDLLTVPQLTRLSLARADIVLVEPDRAALAVLSPGVTIAGSTTAAGAIQPGCQLPAATLAGDADMAGITFAMSNPPAGAVGCYPADGRPSLVRYAASGTVVTVLGTGLPLANQFLADRGNAALALNLLSTSHRIVWLTSQPAATGGSIPAEPGSPPLIPVAAFLVALQLAIAVALAALWRARRFGPLVPEQLPVVVRASETVEGHARLYQSRRARARAAAVIREAMLARVRPALGLAQGAAQDAVADAIASRSRLSQQQIAGILFGPPPASDADLVALVRSLDELEREVRSQ